MRYRLLLLVLLISTLSGPGFGQSDPLLFQIMNRYNIPPGTANVAVPI